MEKQTMEKKIGEDRERYKVMDHTVMDLTIFERQPEDFQVIKEIACEGPSLRK